MKLLLSLTAFALLTVVSSLGRPAGAASAHSEDTERLIASERAWARAAVDGDPDTMAKFMSDDYLEIQLVPATSKTKAKWETGTKAAWIDSLRSGREKYDSVDVRDLEVFFHGDVATVTGEYSQTGTKDGKDNSATGSYVDTWVKRNGKWYLVSSVFP